MRGVWFAAALCLLPLASAGAQTPRPIPQQPQPLPAPQPIPPPQRLPTPNIISFEYTARTAAPVRRSGEITAGTLTWSCNGSRCTIRGPWAQPGVSACAALAQQVGTIVSYGRTGAMLSAEQLAQCNAAAPAPAPVPAPTPAPASGGVAITTAGLFAEGAPAAFAPPPVFVTQNITTRGLSAEGSPDATTPGAFTPRAITTAPLSAEGAPP
jgi:hypothetical protein